MSEIFCIYCNSRALNKKSNKILNEWWFPVYIGWEMKDLQIFTHITHLQFICRNSNWVDGVHIIHQITMLSYSLWMNELVYKLLKYDSSSECAKCENNTNTKSVDRINREIRRLKTLPNGESVWFGPSILLSQINPVRIRGERNQPYVFKNGEKTMKNTYFASGSFARIPKKLFPVFWGKNFSPVTRQPGGGAGEKLTFLIKNCNAIMWS